jgi:hypothetical protein
VQSPVPDTYISTGVSRKIFLETIRTTHTQPFDQDNHVMRNMFFFLFLLVHSLSAYPVLAQIKESLIGDESDGSMAVPVHVIPLLDETGAEIIPGEEPIPFSVKQTCALKCHNYQTIHSGWHFNATDPDVDAGRPGQPWIYVDSQTGTQIPLSYRCWPGTYTPDAFGLSPFQFTKLFGRHFPGGGAGEQDRVGDDSELMRWFVSGTYEINCLSCHDAHSAHDQAEASIQLARENFRWAGPATSSFTSVTGSAASMPDTYDYMMPEPVRDSKKVPPTVDYAESPFTRSNHVFFDVVRDVPNSRCYFCHSSKNVEEARVGKWIADEDVHLQAGLHCVDCHRNGLDHNIVRGYAGEIHSSTNPLSPRSSCEGCHLGDDQAPFPVAGRMGAPVPAHRGIPVVHFETMACTACHAGVWPQEETQHVKTSMAHRLGTHNVDKQDNALPHIQTPVFVKDQSGKLAPHHLFWPSFWGTIDGESLTPLHITDVVEIVGPLQEAEERDASGWHPVSDAMIRQALQNLAPLVPPPAMPVYVSGGKLYSLDPQNQLTANAHPSAQPYTWPIAHNVRPTAQSLGIRQCQDCHDPGAPFFFGRIAIDTPVVSAQGETMQMVSLQQLDATYETLFGYTFRFRTLFKIILKTSLAILALLFAIFLFRGTETLLDKFQQKVNQ